MATDTMAQAGDACSVIMYDEQCPDCETDLNYCQCNEYCSECEEHKADCECWKK